MPTVLIAEDHPLYREGIVRAVEEHPDLHLGGVAADGEQALQMARRALSDDDVLLLDLELPGLAGIDVLRQLRQAGSAVRVLVLSAEIDPKVVHLALKSGADGYVNKGCSRAEICEKILQISVGRVALSDDLHESLLREIHRGARREISERRLSTREREVLNLIAEGLTNQQIAGRLYLSLASVKTYVHRVCRKLETRDRASAVAVGIRQGLLSLTVLGPPVP